jgi:hypothetical protein
MKVLIAIFISLQIITNNTFVEDVARIPSLIEHYNHHTKEETPDISFLDFVLLHYASNDNSNDIHHDSLPLKHGNDVGHIHLISAFTIPDYQFGFSVQSAEISYIVSYTQFVPNNNLDAIFQPPKFSTSFC